MTHTHTERERERQRERERESERERGREGEGERERERESERVREEQCTGQQEHGLCEGSPGRGRERARTELGGAGGEDDMSVTFRLDGVDDELGAVVGSDHPVDHLCSAARGFSFGAHGAARQQKEGEGG